MKNPLKGSTQMYDINQDLDYFTREEFACQYTGENEISDRLLLKLDLLRARCGFPFVITSGYRSKEHNEELMKKGYPASKTTTHMYGVACDIACDNSKHRFEIIKALLNVGITRIGVNKTFIHCDVSTQYGKPNNVIWTY